MRELRKSTLHTAGARSMPDPLVTRPPQVQPYLGVEHRVESIHIHIFTHQLQEERRGGMRMGRLGPRAKVCWRGTAGRQRGEQSRLKQAWGLTVTQNRAGRAGGPCLQKVPQRVPQTHSQRAGIRGTQKGQDSRDRLQHPARIWG